MKHMKVLSHEAPALARSETSFLSFKDIIGGPLVWSAQQWEWVIGEVDAGLRK